MFRNAKLVIRPEQALTESDLLQKAIASVPSIAPKTDGRTKRIDAAADRASCN
jgi:hypothetical protein